jgi:hypothetical protein
MRLPDFLIAGAPRSGTTWLYHLLARHPGAHMASPPRPEPKFFLADELYARGLEWYARTWFEHAPVDAICGEKSTNYLESAAAARRIARDLPSVKLVFILREPAERAWSNYLWSRMNGMESETFEQALALEESRERNLLPERRFSRPHAYFSRGLYADLLQPWFELFPRQNILCLRCEDIALHPRPLAERLHQFLCVPLRPHDADGLGVINAADRGGAQLPAAETLGLLRARYAEPNRRLARLVGPDFEIWS